jgi:phage FluMu protein Com
MNPLHATIEEFAAERYTHIECFCPRCRVIRLRPISDLPKISMGLTLAHLSTRLRCAECSGPLLSVKPWQRSSARSSLPAYEAMQKDHD